MGKRTQVLLRASLLEVFSITISTQLQDVRAYRNTSMTYDLERHYTQEKPISDEELQKRIKKALS